MMALEWNEWECPHCRRIGHVDNKGDYENGETMRMECPNCHREVVVLCAYEPTFYAYRPEDWRDDEE
jgi:hypothetical protein